MTYNCHVVNGTYPACPTSAENSHTAFSGWREHSSDLNEFRQGPRLHSQQHLYIQGHSLRAGEAFPGSGKTEGMGWRSQLARIRSGVAFDESYNIGVGRN